MQSIQQFHRWLASKVVCLRLVVGLTMDDPQRLLEAVAEHTNSTDPATLMIQ